MSRLPTPALIGIAVIVATAINLVIFTVGSLLGASYRFTTQGQQMTVEPITLVGFSSVPLAIGLAIAALLSLRWRWVLRVALAVGPVLALGSIFIMTVPAGFDTTSLVCLALCHTVLVPVMIVTLLAIRARRPAPPE